MVNKDPIQVGNSNDPKSGLKMFRQIENCNLQIAKDCIQVNYYEWLESPNGTKLNESYKNYIVKDEPAIMDGEEELVPANLNYTGWANFSIQQSLIGAKLGNDIIIGAIKKTLKEMPFDAPSGYITQP